MAGDHRLLLAQGIDQTHHVADQMQQGVLVDRVGPIGPPIAAHVGRHGVEPRLGQGAKLMAPGVPGFRKPMAQQDERSRALLRKMHADAVRLNKTMRRLGHGTILPGCSAAHRGIHHEGTKTQSRE